MTANRRQFLAAGSAVIAAAAAPSAFAQSAPWIPNSLYVNTQGAPGG